MFKMEENKMSTRTFVEAVFRSPLPISTEATKIFRRDNQDMRRATNHHSIGKKGQVGLRPSPRIFKSESNKDILKLVQE